ncbi:MAG: RidA family protein [Pseudomonadota bacterium]
MTSHAIVPFELKDFYDDWRMSPGLVCNGFVFLTGFTGARADGSLSADPEAQIRDAFRKVDLVLESGGMDYGHLVEMTTYHVGLKNHFDIFRSVRAEFVVEPYPAWTAIEVAGFVREGAIIEIRAIAREPK